MTKESRTPTQQNEHMLSQAFQAFNETTQRFQEAYNKLEERVAYLSRELAEKNKDLNKKIGELEQIRKYLNNILESVSDGVIALDLNGIVTTFNKAAEHITGFTAYDVIGKHFGMIFPEWKRRRDVVREVSFPNGQETTLCNKSGTGIPGIVYTSLITDEFSNVMGIVITFTDVSKIKYLENEIERSRRLAALGEMAAGVAHEIRNPLGGIEMYASLLERECSDDERKKDIAHSIIEGVRSLNKIISEMLTFTRAFGRGELQKINLIDCLESAIGFALPEIQAKNIQLVPAYTSSECVYVIGETDQLKQVFLNVLLNAAQAIDHANGIIRVACIINEGEGAVAIDIEDNGSGISPENREKIFNPFFTTKSGGTGLGLAVSYRIMEAHTGTIRMRSSLQAGTTFSIIFPLAEES